MPAEIESMAYAKGLKPWHGLGKEVGVGLTPEQMRIEAGLDWDVTLAPLSYRFKDQGGVNRSCSLKEKALIRLDTGAKLSVVGPRYVPFQNEEVLAFFEEYVAAGDMHLETAGSLMDGRYIWALAKMKQSFIAGPGKEDRNEGYVLLVNPHEYGKGATVKFTNVSVVCWNTMQAALGGGGDSIKLWHTREFDADMRQEAKERLGIAKERIEALEEDVSKLIQLEIDTDTATAMALRHFRGTPEKPSRPAQQVLTLFNGEGMGMKLPSRAGTAWGFFNAVTEYTDHHYGKSQDTRVSRAWLGAGGVIKRRVMADLMAKVPA